jgi:hypothetical protein
MPDNGLVVVTPTSITQTGTGSSASIGTSGRVSFTACATLSLNGVFTTSYNNYMIMGRHSTSADYTFRYRFRNSGSDATDAGYVSQYVFSDGTAISASRTTTTYADMSFRGNTQRAGFTAYVFGPRLAQPTALRSILADDYLGGAVLDLASTHSQSTAYDGITLIASAGSFTGEVTVYAFTQ